MSPAGSDSSIDDLAPKGASAPRHPKPTANSGSAVPRQSAATSASQVWLDGDVLSCACPDCGAPMTIRLWLAVAECRMCGAQVELTEEQEREAQKLWESRATPRPPDAAKWAAPSLDAPAWTQPPRPTKPLPKLTAIPVFDPPKPPVPPPLNPPVAQPTAPLVAIPVIEPPPLPTLLTRAVPVDAPPVVEAPPRRRWIPRTLLETIISCLVSLVVHMALILVLGLWLFEKPPGKGMLVLKADFRMAGRQEQKVEAVVEVKPKPPATKTPVEKPVVAPEVKPPSKPEPLKLNREVAELVTAPPPPEVNYFAAGVVRPGTMFAGRDPRFRADIVRNEGGTDRTERAVALGLKWLAAHQEKDGTWSLNRFSEAGDCDGRCGNHGMNSDTAATALGLLPFLGAGHTQNSGEYRELVRRGIDALIAQQRPDGSFDRIDGGRMYAHGLATIVLCEAYALTRDRQLQAPAQRAIDYIVAAQHTAGGWRYTPRMAGDLSVVGWQLMALRSAQTSYLEVPKTTLDRAAKFLDAVQTSTKTATFGYMSGRDVSPAMTAEGLLSRLYGGASATEPALLAGADYLLEDHLPAHDDVDLYYWYYGTQAMHHLGGPRWTRWNNVMRELLVDLQIREGHAAGSWDPGGHHDHAGGRVYATALAICTLEVYYRHLPLYRTQPPAAAKLR